MQEPVTDEEKRQRIFQGIEKTEQLISRLESEGRLGNIYDDDTADLGARLHHEWEVQENVPIMKVPKPKGILTKKCPLCGGELGVKELLGMICISHSVKRYKCVNPVCDYRYLDYHMP